MRHIINEDINITNIQFRQRSAAVWDSEQP